MFPHRLMLTGAAGACARNNHLPAISVCQNAGQSTQVALAVDLQSRRSDLAQRFQSSVLAAPELFVIPDEERDQERLSPAVAQRLLDAVRRLAIDGIVIATEPQSHLAYLHFALDAGLPHILVEKPLSAPPGASLHIAAADRLFHDYLDIRSRLAAAPQTRAVIMAQRRYHAGYEFVRQLLAAFLEEFRVPISFLEFIYSDGQMCLPTDYRWPDHPFHFGYGKLLHGGVHFVGLLADLMALNQTLPEKSPNSLSIYSRSRRPLDNLLAVPPADLDRLFPGETPTPAAIPVERPDELGETDVHAHFTFERNERVVSQAALHLRHTGISRRAWRQSAADRYKRNGRIRQELARIEVNSLLAIDIRSQEAYEAHDKPSPPFEFDWELGGPRHFEITIWRNADLVGGAAVERLEFGKVHSPELGARSLVEEGRRLLIRDFLSGGPTRSDLSSHLDSYYLMGLLSRNLAREHQGQIPLTRGIWPPETPA